MTWTEPKFCEKCDNPTSLCVCNMAERKVPYGQIPCMWPIDSLTICELPLGHSGDHAGTTWRDLAREQQELTDKALQLLKKERERADAAEQKLGRAHSMLDQYAETERLLNKELRDMREALREYGAHHFDCPRLPCDCGLEVLLSRKGEWS